MTTNLPWKNLGFSSDKPKQIIGWPEEKGKRRKFDWYLGIRNRRLEAQGQDWRSRVMSSSMGESMTDVDLIVDAM